MYKYKRSFKALILNVIHPIPGTLMLTLMITYPCLTRKFYYIWLRITCNVYFWRNHVCVGWDATPRMWDNLIL